MRQPPEHLWGPNVLGEREELLIEAERIAHVGTWAWDMRTGNVAWSEELYRILGRDPGADAATFDNFIASIHPEDRARVKELSERAAAGDVAERADFRVVRPGGAIREVMGLAQIFRDPQGVPHRMVGAIMDVTEGKLLEQRLVQAQKMEALGRLAGGIAHDFNNLLTVILLNVQFLRARAKEHPDRLDEVFHAASRAAELTAQLLAFSRRAPQRAVRLDLNCLVTRMRSLLERVIGEDVEIVFEPAAASPMVLAPEAQLEQVLMNLAVNARDAMPAGGRLTIRTAVEAAGAGRRNVRLSVSDTGTGMDAAMRARIFEPFFTTKAPGKGTGLGLSTVFGVVSQCGGVVDVESEPGRGSTFHVILPCAFESTDVSVAPRHEAAAGTGETILLVEDEMAVRATVANVLREAGYDVLSAERPSAALSLWGSERTRIALLLCDLVMPEMDGRQLARRLRDDEASLPIVLMTGYDPEEGHRGSSASHVLSKPFSAEELLATVRAALARG
jgi:two-component system cell cycle sensor histidine kinase/response regulator CckA